MPIRRPRPASLVEIANTVEAAQDGRIYVELVNGPFLFREKATPDEYQVGLELFLERRTVAAALRRDRLRSKQARRPLPGTA